MMQTFATLLDIVFWLAAMLFLVRFLLQACGADFYNPISQAVVKATDSVCKPLRRVIPGYKNLDFAAFIVAWLVSVLFLVAINGLQGLLSAASVLPILLGGIVRTLLVLIQFYTWTIFIMVIASFVAQGSYHPALGLLQQLVEPLLAPVRRVLPNFGPLDLSPLVVVLVLFILQDALVRW